MSAANDWPDDALFSLGDGGMGRTSRYGIGAVRASGAIVPTYLLRERGTNAWPLQESNQLPQVDVPAFR